MWLDHNAGVGLDRNSVVGVKAKEPLPVGEKVVPAQAAPNEVRIERVGDFRILKMALEFEDNE